MRAALRQAIFSDPFDQWARGSIHAWDFLNGTARFNYGRVGRATSTPGWSYTRADSQNAYAQTPGGVLVPFATGQLRRVDGKGVLTEGARTNLCLQSQTFDNASWSLSQLLAFGSGSIVDATTAPDGTSTADAIVENTSATVEHIITQSFTKAASSITYALSVYVKPLGSRDAYLRLDSGSGSNACQVPFTLSGAGTVGLLQNGGTFTGAAGNITALANGWYRITLLATTGTETTLRARIFSYNGATAYTGDGTSGLYLWGAQLEAGACPSSYVPTVAASATRAADVLTVPVSVSAPFSLLLDAEPVGTIASVDGVSFDTTTNGSGIYLGGTGIPNAWVRESSATTAAVAAGSATAIGTPFKVAARFANNDTKACQGGTLSSADASNSPPATTTLKFGAVNIGGTSSLIIRRAALWTRALSDAELQAVTT